MKIEHILALAAVGGVAYYYGKNAGAAAQKTADSPAAKVANLLGTNTQTTSQGASTAGQDASSLLGL